MQLNNYLYQIVDFLFYQQEQLQQLEIHPTIEIGVICINYNRTNIA